MVSRENHLPIDRVKLSKGLKVDVEKILLRPQSYFNTASIETKLGVVFKILINFLKKFFLNLFI